MKKILIIFTLLLITTLRSLFAQTFPVQVTTQLIPPYSIHLADYVAPGTERLAVNIFLRDVNRPELRVRLKVRIEGQGIVLQTKPSYLPPALSLQGGLSERLISTDLADYFNPNNLDFTGITKRQFLQTGALPEGVYRFTIEVLEYNRGVKISNSGTAIAWLILNDPPLVNIPKIGEKVRAQYPQNMTFQWTPRHTGSPNSAFNTEYEFRMVEIWPEGRNPNDAIRTSNTFFEQTTQSTSLIYGIAEPALIPGRSYAFQVRAKSIVGIDELDLFKNDGYSQVHTFTFGDACLAPTELTVEDVTHSKIKLSWKGTFNHTAYTISYREANDPDAEWFQEETFFTDYTITSLKEDTEYEFQVLSACATLTGEETEVLNVTTEAPAVIDLKCGLPPKNFTFDNNTPLTELIVGDRIKAGDFSVKITKVEGSNGIFTGDGTMVLPLMNNVKVKVKFKSITVNDEYRMIAGHMEVVGASLDLLPDEVAALIDDLNETLDDIEDALDDALDVLDDIDDAIDAVSEILEEIEDYLPEEIIQEIEDAKEALATAKQAMSAATTDEAKEAAKVEVKAARGKMKGGIKKAVKYYAKVIKDMIKIIKESIKELVQENQGKESTVTSEYNSAKNNLDQLADSNTGSSGALEIIEINEKVIEIDESSTKVSNNQNLKDFVSSYKTYHEKRRSYVFVKLIVSFGLYYNTTDKLKKLGIELQTQGESLLKQMAIKLKNRESVDQIKIYTKAELTIYITTVANR